MSKFEIKMPKLGESITEGTIVSWSVKPGDFVKEDDVLFEVNTAKVSAEIPSPVEGKILEIFFKEGDTVSVGTVVATVELEAESEGESPSNEHPAGTKPEEETKEQKIEAPAAGSDEKPADKTLRSGSERWYSPAVLEKAKEAGLNQKVLDSLQGTGYEGRLTRHDLDLHLEGREIKPLQRFAEQKGSIDPQLQPSSETPAGRTEIVSVPVRLMEGDEVIPMDPVRKIIADRMSASKKISPHVTNVIEVDVSNLVKWRENNKETFKKREGYSLTFMPAIAEATVKALKDYPRVNSSVDGYRIIQRKNINLGIAVSLNDGNLIVPVVKNADILNIKGLSASIHSLADKARKNKLSPQEIEGGTFTITNFGSFKSLFGTPIINQPEVAILGVGVVEKKACVVETPEGDVIAIRHKIYLSLSYDHRVVDGSLGCSFLYRIGEYLEHWEVK